MRRFFACVLLLAATAHAELFPFSMPWDDASANLTNLSSWNHKPAGKFGPVRVEQGHLFAGSERIRFLGVNIVFGAAFPTRDEADKMAARLARFGINAVRFHHLDSRPAPDGLLQKDMKTLDPAQLERFDYFVSALKREGIYSNINLHVGRKYPGFADWGDDTPKYWKGVDLFFPPMIAMQKDYASSLLHHRNPYTGNRYAEESAVALVEINNENGLIREWQQGNLDGMTEPYLGELNRRWLSWLKKRYRNSAGLRAGWGGRERELGRDMLGERINVRGSESGWNLQLQGGAQAQLEEEESGALRLDLQKSGNENAHIQLHQGQLNLKGEEPYTLGLRLRADRPMKLAVTVMQGHAPWQRLWSQEISVTEDWQSWRPTFALIKAEENARFTITGMGQKQGKLWLGGVTLQPGGILGLRPGEGLDSDTISVPKTSDFASLTPQGQRDWLTFLWETEAAYWQGMHAYLRDELGVKAPIIGTQVSYSPAPIQGALDVVDGHAYWQHPRFPGKPWDGENWQISNSPMAGVSTGGTIPDLALRRVPGKPFVVTEYNHPAPSLYQAEALPLIAAWGAMQDWDGVFVYSYGSHTRNLNPGWISGYFDSQANPVKMASLISSAALLRRGDVTAPPARMGAVADTPRWIEAMRMTGKLAGADALGAARTSALYGPVSLAGETTVRSTELNWGATSTIDTLRSKAVIGARAGVISLSGLDFELLDSQKWGVLSATVLEGKDFATPGRILLSALGRVENTGQKWRDDKKTSLGRDWGQAPVLAEGLAARIVLPVAANRVDVWALDERGNRREALPVSGSDHAVIELDARYRTLWYEVVIHPAGLSTLWRSLW